MAKALGVFKSSFAKFSKFFTPNAIILIALYNREKKAMPHILVRDVDSDIVERLKSRAKQHGRSLQGEVKAILSESVPYSMKQALEVSKKWKKRLAGRKFSDSTVDIREDRER